MRKLAGVIVLALVAAVAPAQAAPDPAPDPAPLVLVKHREYGDGIVRIKRSFDVAHIVFHGKKGDRVAIQGFVCALSLVTKDGQPVPGGESGLYRLPERTTYTFVVQPCNHLTDTYVQLLKLIVRPLRVDGPPITIRKRFGFMKAASVRVPASGRIQVTPDRFGGSEWPRLVFTDGTMSFPGNRLQTAADVALEAGQPALTQGGPLYGQYHHPLQAGDQVLFVIRKATTLMASRAVSRDVTVDGPAVTVSNVGRPHLETQLSFDGVAGQWVNLEQDVDLVGRGERFRYHSLIGPDGRVVNRALLGKYPFWQLPETGRYRMLVETGAAPVTADVRVRTVRVVGAMPLDGSPLTFATASPGEWMLATLTTPDVSSRHLRIVRNDSSAAWSAYGELAERPLCPLDDGPGCLSYRRVEVDASHQFYSAFDTDSRPWTVLVAMPPGGMGSVTLAVPEDTD